MRGGPLVVVGDTLLDVDLHGTVGRIAPDARCRWSTASANGTVRAEQGWLPC